MRVDKDGYSVEILNGDASLVLGDMEQKFQFVYMDPPYDTGRIFNISAKEDIGFSDRFSDDEYVSLLDNMIGCIKSKLANDGVLCLHISAEQSFKAEVVLTKHFKNINKIFWKRCHGKNTVKTKLGAVIDILYECSQSSKKFNLLRIPLENTKWAFKNKDERGNYSLGALKHDRTRKGYDYEITHNSVTYRAEHGWKIARDEMDKLVEDNRIHYAVNAKMLYRKVYEHEHQGKPLSNLWDDIHSITRTTKDPRLYPTQKPVKLLERLVLLYTDEGDWVLDPVAGSGTTGQACLNLRRNCILIDRNKDATDVMLRRFA
jgi:DNA modification methylase